MSPLILIDSRSAAELDRHAPNWRHYLKQQVPMQLETLSTHFTGPSECAPRGASGFLYAIGASDGVLKPARDGEIVIVFNSPADRTEEIISVEPAGVLAALPLLFQADRVRCRCCRKVKPRRNQMLSALEFEVGETPAALTSLAAPAAAAPDATADATKVSRDNLRRSVQELEAFGTRFAYSSKMEPVKQWLEAAFKGVGYDDARVTRQRFPFPSAAPQENVLCQMDPARLPEIVVCAHYDSICSRHSPASTSGSFSSIFMPEVPAPGADDNATGIAVLMEAARILRGQALSKNILFAAFGGEEKDLYGSRECARIAKQDHWPLELVVNLDMLAWQDALISNQIDLEYDQGNEVAENDAPAKAAAMRMTPYAVQNGLTATHSDIDRSDYMEFEKLGYPCIGIFEGHENPNYHTAADLSAPLNFEHLEKVAQTLVDFLMQEAL